VGRRKEGREGKGMERRKRRGGREGGKREGFLCFSLSDATHPGRSRKMTSLSFTVSGATDPM
jgi:hypothetical protein